jgi:lysophospholipid acyltransferase (LPLAT)-like uncharacterized protein
MKALRIILGWTIGLITIAWRFSCRIRHHNDTRQNFFEQKQPFVLALLHAHMITGILGKNPHSVVMASRSDDGDLIAPSIWCAGMRPVRGSSRKKGQSKGGEQALAEMSRLLEEEAYNPVLTVDGPRGPRNFVHRGVATLAFKHQCPVIPLTPLASRTKILHKTWDRTHIPMPLSTINMHWGEPLTPHKDETMDAFRTRVGLALRQAEQTLDPDNAPTVDDDSQLQFT